MADAAIVVENLVVRKNKKPILDSLNMSVETGTIVGLLGPSGSGKTTLMRSLVGLQKFKGTAKILNTQAGSKHLRSRVGYMSQDASVYDDITVAQNITYFARINSVSKQAAQLVIKAVKLEPQASQLVRTLSGGQRARVSLAIALLSNPDVLILDEPTVGLDPLLRNELWHVFGRLAEQGKTIIVSSHVMDEAERCEQLVLLREGSILWDGKKSELLQQTKQKTVEAAFLQLVKKGRS